MNYLALCDKLLKETGLSDQGVSSVIGQSGLNKKAVDWINRAWVEIQNLSDWEFLWQYTTFNTVVNQQDYDPVINLALSPSLDKWIPNSVRITENNLTGYLSYTPWSEWVRANFSSGKPTSFTIRPDNQILYVAAEQDAPELYQDAQSQLNIRLSAMGTSALPTITLAERPVA